MLTALADIAAAPGGTFATVVVLSALLATGLGLTALWHFVHARQIANTPASLIRSAAQGRVELQGFAKLMPGPKISAPLTGTPCVWWRFSVMERVRDNDNKVQWRTVRSGASDDLFLLVDHTGECVVDPHGAKIVGQQKLQWYGNAWPPDRGPKTSAFAATARFRYVEQHIPILSPLHGAGWFRSQNAYQEMDERADVAALLRDWKTDQGMLLERFDADGNGEIDLEEWEAVRAAALEEVRAQHLQDATETDLHVLCEPPANQVGRLSASRRYVLSTLDEHRLIRRGYVWAGVFALLFLTTGWIPATLLILRQQAGG